MNELTAKIEAVLFLSPKGTNKKTLKRVLEVSDEEIETALAQLREQKNVDHSGIHILQMDDVIELGTNPKFADVLEGISKEENTQELTRPQLETLTIIAYRGPITKAEIEHIRGVNCALILRNLLTRGLITEKEDKVKFGEVYTISSELLRFLGIASIDQLPDYQALHANEKITQMLEKLFQEQAE